MIDPTTGKRLPCQRCGGRMYYNEREQEYCASCARALGILRICDRPWGLTPRRPTPPERDPVTILEDET